MSWFLNDKTLGGVTWLGTILGLLAILLTYRQARAARTAAEAARAAVENLRGRINVANLAYSYSQIDLVKTLVQKRSLGPAQTIFHSIKRMVIEACATFASDKGMQGQLAIVKRNLQTVEHQIELGILDLTDFKPLVVTRALGGIATFLAEREQQLKYGSEA